MKKVQRLHSRLDFYFPFAKHKRNIIGNIYASFFILTNLSVFYGAKSTRTVAVHRSRCNVLYLCFFHKEKKITALNILLLWSQVLGPTPFSAFLPDFLLSKSHHISSNNRSKIMYLYRTH